MKTVKYQRNEERSILTGMIVSDLVLSRIYAQIKTEKRPFRSKWCNLVSKWCLDFFTTYGKAPGPSIQALFESYASATPDDAIVALVEELLSSLNEDYKAEAKAINADFLIDTASRYFSEVRFDSLQKALEADVLKKDIESAQQHYAKFAPISFASTATMELLTDSERLISAFDDAEADVLVNYPGALGEFFDVHLQRDGFISFLAPDKRGKSYWLLDAAWRAAVKEKRRVLYFSVGDLSEKQMWRRFGVRAARWPLRAETVIWPKEIKSSKDSGFMLKTEQRIFEKGLSGRVADEAMKLAFKKTASSSSLLKFECSANSTTTVADIQARVEEKIREGWIPDLIVIDYADILAPEVGASKLDYRHQINETWKAMRRLSQEYHVLVLTATQTNKGAYGGKLITRQNFSEDKRKLAHVTGMVGLNQTEEEKAKGIYRLNWIVLREGSFYENRCVACAGTLAVANPAMVSTW